MEAQLEFSWGSCLGGANPILAACGSEFLADFDLEMAVSLGGRILPVVGTLNSGAKHVLEEFREQAETFGLAVLSVKIAPTGQAMESVIDAIARAAECPSVMKMDLFGSLPTCLQEKGIRIITLEGASHLSYKGIREMTQLCLSSSDGPLAPLIIWHAKPGWELAYRPDAPPRSFFLGSIPMPVVEFNLPEKSIRRAFPHLERALNPTSDLPWSRVIDATNGELGSLLILENVLARRASGQPSQPAADETKVLARLLDMLFGKHHEVVTKQSAPDRIDPAENLGSTKSLPGDSALLDPPVQTTSKRGSYGKRRR